ncbi:MAG: hypothetical protein ABUT39_14245 [Acidobacteriota bacterium]
MNVKIPLSPPSSAGRRVGVLLLVALGWSVPHAQAQVDPAIRLFQANCSSATQPQKPQITFSASTGSNVGPNANPALDAQISVKDEMLNHFTGNVFWKLSTVMASGCTGNDQSMTCGPFTVLVPPDPEMDGSSPATSAGRVQISGTNVMGTGGAFSVEAAEAPDGDPICKWNYLLSVTASGGGWGDPHLTTVNGVDYDFQSAGEFTALREDRFEVQTRQTPVPTTYLPGANDYTGLRSCVSIYTAVAARIGKNRVTLQPDPSGEPSANHDMQLRVNGKLVTLPESGIDLPGDQPGILDGRIVRVGAAYQITDARGTQLVVTPAFWDSQKVWYLNVNVYQTAATAGVMGRLAEDSWLPALPDGTSLGSMPESLNERYQQLYEKFADAWRVTDATSLFDYAPGTNTATFTLDEWPRLLWDLESSCALAGQTSVMPATPEVAAEACKGVTDAAKRANCVFDVTVTGHTGFGQSYEAMQNIKPHGTGWQPALGGAGQPTPTPTPTPPPTTRPWPWWWWILILILVLIVIIVLSARKKKTA